MALSIEFEEPSLGAPCECCGNRTVHLIRFVSNDGDAHAVYYVRFTEGHPETPAVAAVSLGDWEEGSTPSQRTAFALELRADGVRVCNADESPWHETNILGRMLDRDEALAHPLIKEVFHITDHIYLEDPPFMAHMNRQPSSDAS
ncbi:hypothetical protein IHE49_11850 [Rhodanobacter sp. 7MK24]|uniref:hypothetical protein n=1 Tax=Rhodanobacter sp. 7MK24 TaxID=2775922 RepID=UPI00177BF862|nr:hypothetical protein [Rhodanobacter sp. 7MK24]MBD8881173.1 hypothetical protein [Rhodanobacter sp. 7MK24]